jgi:hypothetical protein
MKSPAFRTGGFETRPYVPNRSERPAQWASRLAMIALAGWLSCAAIVHTTYAQNPSSTPFAVEYYYKVQWGHFAEFLDLYKRNHYPILQRLQSLGRIVDMSAAVPVNHAGEASRWDFRFTIVWKDAATAYEDFDETAIVEELYPDQERFKREEQRRFELLLEHMDVPVEIDDLGAWE